MFKRKNNIFIFIIIFSMSCFNMKIFNKGNQIRKNKDLTIDTTRVDSSLNLDNLELLDLELDSMDD